MRLQSILAGSRKRNHHPQQHDRVVKVDVKKVMVEDAAKKRAEHCAMRTQEDGAVCVIVFDTRPGSDSADE